MHVEQIISWHKLTAIESDWNALAGEMPFRSWDWLATWWKYYGAPRCDGARSRDLGQSRELYVLAVYDSENTKDCNRQLVGIAPWYIERSAIKGSVVRWLGDGEVYTDHLSLVCRTQDAERVSSAIAEALASLFVDWDRLELSGVDEDDEPISKLMLALQDLDAVVAKETVDQCWILDLPASWDDYLASISKSHRKQLRQLERRRAGIRSHRVARGSRPTRAQGSVVRAR